MPELVVAGSELAAIDGSAYLETHILDPRSEDASNSPLCLTGRVAGDSIYLGKVTFPEPEQTVTRATGRDVEGDKPVGMPTHRNRVIDYEVVVNEARGVGEATNLVTNPSPSSATTGYVAALGTGTLSLSTDQHRGSAEESLKMVTPGSVTLEGIETQPSLTVVGGDMVYAYAWVWIPEGVILKLGIRERDATDTTTIGTSYGDSIQGVGGWVLLSASRLFASGNTKARLKVVTDEVVATTFYVTQATLCEGADPVFPFDGDTPGARWSGTAGASASVRYGSGEDRVRFEAALFDLESKLQKFMREGGTMKRYLPDGTWGTFDVVGAKFTGDNWDRPFNQGFSLVQFELECLPYWRGDEVSLSAHTETTKPVLVFTEPKIAGNVPALGRLIVTDIQPAARQFLVVGARQKNYDAAAPLYYEAETWTPVTGSGATTAAVAGASGGNAISYPYGTGSSDIGGNKFLTETTEHVGTYRIFARVQVPTGSGINLILKATQGTSLRASITTNIPTLASWHIADLGLVDLSPPLVGSPRAIFELIAATVTPATGGTLYIDWIAFIPTEIGWSLDTLDTPVINSGKQVELRHDGAIQQDASGNWQDLTNFYGDRMKIPPSGKAGRTTEFAVLASRGALLGPVFTSADLATYTDGSIDDIEAQLIITPRGINVPDPV